MEGSDKWRGSSIVGREGTTEGEGEREEVMGEEVHGDKGKDVLREEKDEVRAIPRDVELTTGRRLWGSEEGKSMGGQRRMPCMWWSTWEDTVRWREKRKKREIREE